MPRSSGASLPLDRFQIRSVPPGRSKKINKINFGSVIRFFKVSPPPPRSWRGSGTLGGGLETPGTPRPLGGYRKGKESKSFKKLGSAWREQSSHVGDIQVGWGGGGGDEGGGGGAYDWRGHRATLPPENDSVAFLQIRFAKTPRSA